MHIDPSIYFIFRYVAPPTTEPYTLSLHDALPIWTGPGNAGRKGRGIRLTSLTSGSTDASASCSPDRKSTRLNSSHVASSYAVFCLKKKTVAPAVSEAQ